MIDGGATKHPADMTPDEYRRAFPAVRVFQRYTSDERASHAASRRLGPRQRAAVGEFFYTHPHAPGLAFPSAAAARRAGQEQARRDRAAMLAEARSRLEEAAQLLDQGVP